MIGAPCPRGDGRFMFYGFDQQIIYSTRRKVILPRTVACIDAHASQLVAHQVALRINAAEKR